MLSVDYSFYSERFHGQMTQSEFYAVSVRAGAYLEDITGGKAVDDLPPDILLKAKFAFCALADVVNKLDHRGDVASETNDGISITYKSDTKSDGEKLYDVASAFLSGTGLLYRGVR